MTTTPDSLPVASPMLACGQSRHQARTSTSVGGRDWYAPHLTSGTLPGFSQPTPCSLQPPPSRGEQTGKTDHRRVFRYSRTAATVSDDTLPLSSCGVLCIWTEPFPAHLVLSTERRPELP